MIKILIIEDEIPARNKLKRFIGDLNTDVEVVAEFGTVAESIHFLENHSVDLIFSDIELLDGTAFHIYEQVQVFCPIIFITAYNQFLMHAFDSQGIAYLLKPFSMERFRKAWDKFLWLRNMTPAPEDPMTRIAQLLEKNLTVKSFKKQFTIHQHQHMYFLATEDIVCFSAENGVIYASDQHGKRHLMPEQTIKEIEDRLDPREFFRINRSELIGKKYVEKIERYKKNTLAVKLKGQTDFLKTSQSQTAAFRKWLEE